LKIVYDKPFNSEIHAPYLPLKIQDLTGNFLHPKKGIVNGLIDTGYDGFILVPLKIFEKLNLMTTELPPDQISFAETIVGEKFKLRTALGQVVIPEISLSLTIEIDTYPTCYEILIGRQLLEFIILILNGPKKILTITTMQE